MITSVLFVLLASIIIPALLWAGTGHETTWRLLSFLYIPLGNWLADKFPNRDEPMPVGAPLDQVHDWPDREARAWWWFRNPFHDLTWYEWGMMDVKPLIHLGRRGTPIAIASKFFNPEGGWLFATRLGTDNSERKYRSYARGRFQFYWGVRPTGAWGAKFRFTKAA